jgi:hypothetical protein
MIEDTMVLWRYCLSKNVDNNKRIISPDELLHESLSGLVGFLTRDGRKWHVEKVNCGVGDVTTDPSLSEGWWAAAREFKAGEGLLPQDAAVEKYWKYYSSGDVEIARNKTVNG